MKELTTTTIEKLLEELEEKKRNEVVTLYDECMKSICCENIQWKNFECFNPSCETMKMTLNALAPEYIMVIADKINQQENKERTVRIAFVNTKEPTSVYTVNQNADITLAYISLSRERKRELEERAKE